MDPSWEGYLDMNNLCGIIKILGVYFGGDAEKEKSCTSGRIWNHLRKPLTYRKLEVHVRY